MTLEDRLSTLLRDAGAVVSISAPGMSPEDRSLRRRRQRRTAGSTLATAVVVVASFGVYRVARPAGGINVAADRQPNTTIASETADAAGPSEPAPRAQTPPLSDSDLTEATDDRATMSAYRSDVPADTGPDLQWTEVAPPAAWDGGQMVWTGSQFVGAVQRASSVELIASADGSEWSTVGSLPTANASPTFVASGDSLVAWAEGGDPTESNEGSADSGAVFLSEDAGRSWDALGSLPTPGLDSHDAASDYVTRTRHIAAAAVSPESSGQQTVVLATMTATDLDVQRLLADNGVVVAEEAAVAYSFDPSGTGMVSVCADLECSSEQTFTLPELGLSDAAVAAATSGTRSTELWRSTAGGPLEPVPVEVRGHTASLTWANDHFVLVATSEQETTLTRSTDGLSWEPLALPPFDGVGSALVSTDATVFLSSWDDLGFLTAHPSTDGGRTWGDGFGLPVAGSALQAGPSGLIAVSAVESPPLTVSKDGYTVSLANQGLLVIDEATDETLLSFDVDALTAEDAPETVIYQEDPYQLTFLRPGSLEPLVTVTEADLLAADPHQGMPPDFVLGWSADGVGWGWQSATEAFGITAWPSIVVGDGVVLSVIYETAGVDGEEDAGVGGDAESASAVPRMFVAKTP